MSKPWGYWPKKGLKQEREEIARFPSHGALEAIKEISTIFDQYRWGQDREAALISAKFERILGLHPNDDEPISPDTDEPIWEAGSLLTWIDHINYFMRHYVEVEARSTSNCDSLAILSLQIDDMDAIRDIIERELRFSLLTDNCKYCEGYLKHRMLFTNEKQTILALISPVSIRVFELFAREDF